MKQGRVSLHASLRIDNLLGVVKGSRRRDRGLICNKLEICHYFLTCYDLGEDSSLVVVDGGQRDGWASFLIFKVLLSVTLLTISLSIRPCE